MYYNCSTCKIQNIFHPSRSDFVAYFVPMLFRLNMFRWHGIKCEKQLELWMLSLPGRELSHLPCFKNCLVSHLVKLNCAQERVSRAVCSGWNKIIWQDFLCCLSFSSVEWFLVHFPFFCVPQPPHPKTFMVMMAPLHRPPCLWQSNNTSPSWTHTDCLHRTYPGTSFSADGLLAFTKLMTMWTFKVNFALNIVNASFYASFYLYAMQ